MSSFFQELKRRNVFRVGVAYVVVAWLIIQVIETVSDPLGLPEWTEAFFIVLLLAGLPVILIFSWAFELTPEGLKKTREVKVEESVTATTGKKLNYATIAVLVMTIGFFLWERQGLVEQAEQTAAEDTQEVTQTEGAASVAVLPFVNMSADQEQEYFSDGISEELLNLLAKIPELRVPARTSSFQFKGQNLDIGKVAEQLNVEHVLEGSVRKSGMRVRVTAQLIEADTGYHLWSDTYDRELDDIFAIQDEISAAIVDALSTTLGLQTSAMPKVQQAANSEAYNFYLLGQHLIKKRTKTDIEAAIPNYEAALEKDPDYAPAHAALGLAWYLLTNTSATYGTLALDESLSKALPHLERALELDPDSPEALGNMGLTYDARQQYEEAVTYYEKALEINPSLTDVRNWYASALGDLGRSNDGLSELEHAYELDPLSVLTLNNYTNALLMRRSFDKVEPLLDRLSQIDPARGASFAGWVRVSQGRAAEGTALALRAVDLETENLRLRSQVAVSLYNLGLHDPALAIWPYEDTYDLVSNGSDFDYLLELAQQRFNAEPNNPDKLEDLAWAYWDAGDREQGLELAQRYLDSLGETRRPLDFANMMFVFDAWQRGEEREMQERMQPLEANVDQAIASGIDGWWVHIPKAIFVSMRGENNLAQDHLEKAAFRSIWPVERMTNLYERMGWDAMPEFAALKGRHRQYMTAERDKLLDMACGPDAFETWQPSDTACGRNATPPVPN